MQGLNHNTLQNTLNWFKEAKPNPDGAALGVQMGVHFEEVTELLDVVMGGNSVAALNVLNALNELKTLADHMKANPELYTVAEDDRQEALDALADQVVTATGSAYMLGFDFIGAMDEVNRSNYSKFVDGKAVLTEQGKIAKGPDYTKPDLTPFV